MTHFLTILLGCVLVAVLAVLITGVSVFVKGGETNKKWGNRLMNLRVATQAVAVLILGLILYLKSR
jgi:hypothetical protein